MPWTKDEKIFCFTTYLETKSFKTVQAKFCRKFNFNNYPRKSQIYHWVHEFQATGSINNLNKKAENLRSSRKLTARCHDNVDAVRDSVGRSPKKFLQRSSQELGLLCTPLQRILKKNLQLYPYRIQIKHKLTTADTENLLLMCQWFKNKIEEDPDFLDDVWFSDEALFRLYGHIISNNCVSGCRSPRQGALEALAMSKMHGLGGHLKTWNNRTVLVWKCRQWGSHCHIDELNKFWRALGTCPGVN